jgi:hypothetical protein
MKRLVIALIAAGAVFSAVFAVAASLGPITPNQIGANDAVVGSCDTDGVSTAYTVAFDTTDDRYEITSVTVSGIAAPACDTQTLQVTLTGTDVGGAGVDFLECTTVASIVGDGDETTPCAGAPAENVVDVHVTIHE